MPTTTTAIATPLISRRTPENIGAVEDGTVGSGIRSAFSASWERSSTRETSPSKTLLRDFRFQGGFGASVAQLEGATPTSLGVSFAGFGSVFDGCLIFLAAIPPKDVLTRNTLREYLSGLWLEY
jgi:hypothetical protein